MCIERHQFPPPHNFEIAQMTIVAFFFWREGRGGEGAKNYEFGGNTEFGDQQI